jgi:ribosomal protein L40E
MMNDLVTVESFRVLPEAEAAKLHLEAEGIRAFLAESEAVDMDWLGGNPLWNVKLQVTRGDAERAAVVLSQMRAQWRRRAETAEDSESLVCLACGAPMPEEASKCAACGWSYAAGESDSAS